MVPSDGFLKKPALSLNWASCRSEEHTSELQSQSNLVCRLLLEKKKKNRLYDSHTAYSRINTPGLLGPGSRRCNQRAASSGSRTRPLSRPTDRRLAALVRPAITN